MVGTWVRVCKRQRPGGGGGASWGAAGENALRRDSDVSELVLKEHEYPEFSSG